MDPFISTSASCVQFKELLQDREGLSINACSSLMFQLMRFTEVFCQELAGSEFKLKLIV